MNASATAAGIGLLSAASWGGSDFVGGLGARKSPAILVVASGHLLSLLILAAICFGAHIPYPTRHDVFFAALGGFEGALALVTFYRALAMGTMGLTATLTGLLTAVVPVIFSIFSDGLPKAQAGVGLALGVAALWMITHSSSDSGPDRSKRNAALMLGAISGLGFGLQLILFKLVSGGGVLWAMTSARAAGVSAMLLIILFMRLRNAATGRGWTATGSGMTGFWRFGLLAGIFDTLGNLLYIECTRFGRLDAAAVICSLYPAGTILLAALVLRERPTARQLAGMGLALAAVALLSV